MITKELRTELEKIPCTLKDGGTFQYLSETKKEVTMKCPVCSKRRISNIIKVNVTSKTKEK